MSLKKVLFSFAKQKDKERANIYHKQNMINKYKDDAIKYSDRYFELEDEGNDYENRYITHYYVDDTNWEEALEGHKVVAKKWVEVVERMELLAVPDLPHKARQLFIDSHNIIMDSAKVKAQFHLINMKKILADLEGNFDLRNEYESEIDNLEKLYYEMQRTYRNAFDNLLYYLDGI